MAKAPTAIGAHVFEEARRQPDGSLAIHNAVYRASFRRGGLMLSTARREEHAAVETWHYRARALETASAHVDLSDVEPVVSRPQDHIVEFRRPGLIERYVGEPTGLEQVFVVTRRPRGHGDVRIRGEVRFDGLAQRRDAGFEFSSRERPAVRYGRPTAFDADGHPVDVRAELHGSRLDLELNGDALAKARFPVTIDPLVMVLSSAAVTYDSPAQNVDVTFNPTRNEFLLVFSARTAGGAQEIRVKRFNAVGDAMGDSVAMSPASTRESPIDDWPDVAYDMHNERYLVVWERKGLIFTSIYGRLLTSTATPAGGEFLINTPNRWGYRPEVVSRNFKEHGAHQPAFFVVWREVNADQGKPSGFYEQSAVLASDAATIVQLTLSWPEDRPFDTDPYYPHSPGYAVAYDPLHDAFFVIYTEKGLLRGRAVAGASGVLKAPIEIAAGVHNGENVPTCTNQECPPEYPDLAFDPASQHYLATWHEWVSSVSSAIFGQHLSSADEPAKIGGDFWLADVFNPSGYTASVPESGGFLTVSQRGWPSDPGGEWALSYQHDPWWIDRDTSQKLHAGERPALATSQDGFTFLAFQHHATSYPRIEKAVLEGWFSHFVHGRSGNFAGDGASDLFLFRPVDGTWHVKSSNGVQDFSFGTAGDIPVLVDTSGDDVAELGLFRPSSHSWHIYDVGAMSQTTIGFGKGGDIPVPGDYTGDGRDDLAVFRPTTGMWYVRDTATKAITQWQWGQVGDVPVPADYNGDGKTDLGVWRPSDGTWYVIGLDGAPIATVAWGKAGDIPLPGNYVGNGAVDLAVYRAHTGIWHIRDGASAKVTSIQWGNFDQDVQGNTISNYPGSNGGERPMPLDWDDDGTLDLVVFTAHDGTWHLRTMAGQKKWIAFGKPLDLPAGSR